MAKLNKKYKFSKNSDQTRQKQFGFPITLADRLSQSPMSFIFQ